MPQGFTSAAAGRTCHFDSRQTRPKLDNNSFRLGKIDKRKPRFQSVALSSRIYFFCNSHTFYFYIK
jgi:hypothetical protein